MAGPPVVNDRVGVPARIGIPDLAPGAKPAAPKVTPQQKAINAAVNALGIPLTDQQIQSQAQGYLNPLVQSLLSQTAAQGQAGMNSIRGYTQSLVDSLKPFAGQAGQIYSGAEQSQAASDAALAQRLTGGGSDQAAQLASRLGSINAPGATNEAVQSATNTGVGTGNALYGTGSASLANLIASGAAAQNYAGKLPGLAGEQGLQEAGNLQGQLASEQSKGLASIQSQIPGLVQSLQGQNQTLRSNRETLRQNILGGIQSAKDKKTALAQEAAALAGKNAAPDASLSRAYGYVVDALGRPIGGKIQPVAGYKVNAAGTGVVKIPTAKSGTGTKAPKVSSTVSNNRNDGNAYDSNGNIIPGVKWNPKSQTSSQSPTAAFEKTHQGLTPGTYQKYQSKAQSLAAIAHAPSAPGKNDALPWLQFLRKAQGMGVPTWIIIQEGRKVYSPSERKLGLIPKAKNG